MISGYRDFETFLAEVIRRYERRNPGKSHVEVRKKIAKAMGVDANTVLRWQTGKIALTSAHLETLLGLINLSLGDCFYFPEDITDMRGFEAAYRAHVETQRRRDEGGLLGRTEHG